jgi:hypothetical protein
MSLRYTGAAYMRRDAPREVFVITPDHVVASRGRRAWKPASPDV